ncbi:androgen-dependent TFPI-regulating protein [Manduca sexta]|uniref:Uncharacterized protein n=1 Tax=Manduca sexta TaxID=7130 RepID=A0A921YWS3_MANSE|nr:androgen-dependent TFPI-regulating protein [Manduca sexta]XP_037296174.1 androgen-dependent TFPI-regulating protein [Manduca sexta]KAG6447283.1 hypothetical protein O3G_MSEX004802 [Manduca sexta]
MSSQIYFRMAGYVITLVMHITNLIAMRITIKGANITQGTLEDIGIRTFKSMEYRYLTTWNVVNQINYAILGLVCDILTIKNRKKKNYKLPPLLRSTRDIIFDGIVLPNTFVVSSLFWTLFLYDRSLVYPEFIDLIVTKASNHVIHTAIVPVVSWEMMFRPRKEPKSHLRNISLLTLYMILYCFVLHFTHYQKGVWLYPILDVLQGVHFILFHLCVAAMGYFYYFAQWKLNKIIHRESNTKKIK